MEATKAEVKKNVEKELHVMLKKAFKWNKFVKIK